MSRRSPSGLGPPGPGARRAECVVPAPLDGQRLDKAVAALVEDLSRGRARKIIAMGGLYLGSVRCRVASRPVRKGDHLTVTWTVETHPTRNYPLEVLHEDADLLVVLKPAGQHVQGTELGDEGTLIRELMRRYGKSLRLMHRIDAPTSGVLLATRNRRASAWLTPQFREHRIERHYDVITEVAPPEGACELPLLREGRRVRLAGPEQAGLSAKTVFSVCQRFFEPDRVHVRAELHTGRTHQIRVHLQALDAAVIGDRRYGGRPASRLCLHARSLAFEHLDGKVLRVEAEPPVDFWSAADLSAPASVWPPDRDELGKS